MASIGDILQHKWPKWQWSMSNDDYSTLVSHANEPSPKPTLAQVRGFSAEVDAVIAERQKNERIRAALQEDGLRLFTIVENLTKAVREIRTKAALRGGQNLTPTLDTALQAAETELTNIRNSA